MYERVDTLGYETVRMYKSIIDWIVVYPDGVYRTSSFYKAERMFAQKVAELAVTK